MKNPKRNALLASTSAPPTAASVSAAKHFPLDPAALPPGPAAAFIGCSRPTLYRLVQRGALTPRKLGRRTLFMVDELRALLASLPAGVSGAPACATKGYVA